MATDPVCGMTVDEASAAGKSVFDGRTFYFCSAHCLRAFEANPQPFVTLKHRRKQESRLVFAI